MSWLILILAGLLEVVWASGLKKIGDAFSLPLLIAVFIVLVASVGLLAVAMRQLPLSLAYPVWVGIGMLGSVLVGMLVFGEGVTPVKWGCIGLIITGMVGLKAL